MRLARTIVTASWLVLAAAALAPLAIAAFVTPEDIESGRVALTPPCPVKARTGVDCPSCGMTRAFAAIAHGRFGDAVRYNRASVVVFAAIGAIACVTAWQTARNAKALARAET